MNPEDYRGLLGIIMILTVALFRFNYFIIHLLGMSKLRFLLRFGCECLGIRRNYLNFMSRHDCVGFFYTFSYASSTKHAICVHIIVVHNVPVHSFYD